MSWQAIGTSSVDFRRHPKFEMALIRHTEGILDLRSRIKHTSKLFGKEERCRSYNIFAILAADADRRGETVVPLAEFLECARQASVSERTAKTVASLLPYFGFADLGVDHADRRRRLLVPRERTWTYMVEWSAPTFGALELLDRPFQGERIALVRRAFASAREDYIRGSLSFFGDDPDFARVFAYLEGGSLLCMSAVSAFLRNEPAPSLGEVSERFCISKAQLARVVAEGRACGLFTAAAKVTPSGDLLENFARTVSVVLAFIAHHRDAVAPRMAGEGDQAAAA